MRTVFTWTPFYRLHITCIMIGQTVSLSTNQIDCYVTHAAGVLVKYTTVYKCECTIDGVNLCEDRLFVQTRMDLWLFGDYDKFIYHKFYASHWLITFIILCPRQKVCVRDAGRRGKKITACFSVQYKLFPFFSVSCVLGFLVSKNLNTCLKLLVSPICMA